MIASTPAPQVVLWGLTTSDIVTAGIAVVALGLSLWAIILTLLHHARPKFAVWWDDLPIWYGDVPVVKASVINQGTAPAHSVNLWSSPGEMTERQARVGRDLLPDGDRLSILMPLYECDIHMGVQTLVFTPKPGKASKVLRPRLTVYCAERRRPTVFKGPRFKDVSRPQD